MSATTPQVENYRFTDLIEGETVDAVAGGQDKVT